MKKIYTHLRLTDRGKEQWKGKQWNKYQKKKIIGLKNKTIKREKNFKKWKKKKKEKIKLHKTAKA